MKGPAEEDAVEAEAEAKGLARSVGESPMVDASVRIEDTSEPRRSRQSARPDIVGCRMLRQVCSSRSLVVVERDRSKLGRRELESSTPRERVKFGRERETFSPRTSTRKHTNQNRNFAGKPCDQHIIPVQVT